jgi:hypothetical protein
LFSFQPRVAERRKQSLPRAFRRQAPLQTAFACTNTRESEIMR